MRRLPVTAHHTLDKPANGPTAILEAERAQTAHQMGRRAYVNPLIFLPDLGFKLIRFCLDPFFFRAGPGSYPLIQHFILHFHPARLMLFGGEPRPSSLMPLPVPA